MKNEKNNDQKKNNESAAQQKVALRDSELENIVGGFNPQPDPPAGH